jgi:hypothetical protein
MSLRCSRYQSSRKSYRLCLLITGCLTSTSQTQGIFCIRPILDPALNKNIIYMDIFYIQHIALLIEVHSVNMGIIDRFPLSRRGREHFSDLLDGWILDSGSGQASPRICALLRADRAKYFSAPMPK